MSITVSTQLYLCANQLHVSAIYNHHPVEQRSIYKKINTMQQNCKDEILSEISLHLYEVIQKYMRKRRLVKGLWKIIRVLKYLMIFSEKIIVVTKL